MDELLVESLGLTKACDTSQSYNQLQICLLSFFDTFIIDNSMRRIAGEHRGLLTVISLTREQLEDIGSDKLPSFSMGPSSPFCHHDVHVDPGCTREPHTPPWFGLEWVCRYFFYGARPFLPLDHHDRAWRCLDRYFFYRYAFADTVSRQQVRWSQVFQLEDPGEEDLGCMQEVDSHGQSSAVSAL